jgi:glycosyltransferase involved in cell wall biosynthesis
MVNDGAVGWQGNGFASGGPALNLQSSVLALVPHFRCEQWLPDGLDSLVRQTRPPQGIVVVDDASGEPPVEIVARFPQVTLLTATENVGPYRLIQQVIDSTNYDAYMFQDADDWSMPERLELLLREAEQSGAEMVGCQGHRLISVEGEVVALTFPLDVNAALSVNPTRHALMHPSSVVSRGLVLRAGGYAGLRYGGDTEFEHRAVHVGRLVNVPEFAYVVRNRLHSLTSSLDTGLESPERLALREREFERARERASLVAAGMPPALDPLEAADPVMLSHLVGPRLAGSGGGAWPS